MDVEKKRDYVKSDVGYFSLVTVLFHKIGEMAEWFKAVDCKSIEISHRRFEPYSLQNRDIA